MFRCLTCGFFDGFCLTAASENPFKSILKTLEKADGGEFGKYYSLPALNDPRIGKFCLFSEKQWENVETVRNGVLLRLCLLFCGQWSILTESAFF